MIKSNPSAVDKKLSHFQTIAFASPTLALFLLVAPMGLLPSIFAKYYGISLVGLGTVLLLTRFFDVITDVLIGHLSDRYRLKHGTRKPFVVIGGLLTIPCAYFLVYPLGGEVTVFSFACWSLAFYLAFTLFSIPFYAWAGEITAVPKERTYLFSLLAFVGQIATLLFFVLPLLPMFETQEITPEVLRFSVFLGACVMLPTLFILIKISPDGITPTRQEAEIKPHSAALADYIAIFKSNKPFQLFMGSYLFLGIGTGMFSGLFFLYVDVFLDLGDEFAKMVMVGLITGLALTPLVYKLALWLGKRNAWLLSTVLLIIAIFYCGTLSPGEAGLNDIIIMQVMIAVWGVCTGIIAPAMLNDTADYGLLTLEDGARGVYFALYIFILKIGSALGLSAGLALAGWLGFDATATQQTADGTFAIRFATCWLPMAITCLGLYFIAKTPLSEAKMEIIGRRLQARAKRSAAAFQQ